MRANADDELVTKGHHLGDADRKAVIIEVDGEEGARFEQLRCCLAQQRYDAPCPGAGLCGLLPVVMSRRRCLAPLWHCFRPAGAM